MITIDKARQLVNQYDNIDDALAYADKLLQDTDLGYWREVKRRIQLKKDFPNYNL